MSRIFDALQQAQRQGISNVEPLRSSLLPLSSDGDGIAMDEEMVSLYQTIISALPNIEHRSVLFVGSRSNEGTSTVARQLAKTVSLRVGRNVLLIDLDRSRPDLHVYGDLRPEGDLNEIVSNGHGIDKALCQVEETSLYVMPLFRSTMVTPRTLDSARSGMFWEAIKEKFDLIIVDSPPATRFPDGPGIVSKVDGVILVVEAEKTRWPVALSVKRKIQASGGNILGIVFNKRRHYIPQWLYKRI